MKGKWFSHFLVFAACLCLAKSDASAKPETNRKFRPDQEASGSSQKGPDNPETPSFKLTKISDGKIDNKTWFKVFEISASNGHSLFFERDSFSSAKQATEELQRYCGHAEEILRRSQELDKEGNVVGQRIFARFPKINAARPPENLPHYTVFWTSGSDFNEIVAEHSEDVLGLESWFKDHSFRDLLKD